MPINPYALAGTAALGGIFGGLANAQSNRWKQGYATNLLDTGNAIYGYGHDVYNNLLGDIQPYFSGNLNRTDQMLFGNDQQAGRLPQYSDSVFGFNPSQFFQRNPYDLDPRLNWYNEQIGNSADPLRDLSNTSGLAYSGRGWSQPGQNIIDSAELLGSGSTSGQQALSRYGQNILANGGMTDQSKHMQTLAGYILDRGGMNNTLDFLNGQGWNDIAGGGQTAASRGYENLASGVMGAGGMNPALQTAQGLAGNILSAGGNTALTNYLSGRGAELLDKNPILSSDQAASLAREQAINNFQKQSESLRRQALARGGGPGVTVANGVSNGLMSDFSDAGRVAEEDAVSKALLGQQALGLQSQGLGAQIAGQGGQLANQKFLGSLESIPRLQDSATGRVSTYGNLGLGAQGLDTQRYLSGERLINDIQGTANQAASIYGNIGMGASGQDIQRLNTGGGFLGNVGQLQLGGLGAGTNQLGSQDQFALGSGNLSRGTRNDISNLYQQIYGNTLQGANQNNAFANAQLQATLAGYGLQGDAIRQLLSYQQAQYNPYLNLLGTGVDYSRMGLGLAAAGNGVVSNLGATNGLLAGLSGGLSAGASAGRP